MAKTLMTWLIVMAMAAPVFADTKNGNANAGSWQRWRFTSPGGEVRATFTWTNTNVTGLFAQVFCGVTSVGVANGGFDRVANMSFGVLAGFPCVIFVTTTGGATSYRMSVRNTTSQDLVPGTTALQLVEDQTQGDYTEALAQHSFEFLALSAP